MSHLVILSTASSLREARRLANRLLDKRLAACVNISSPMASHYWWKGKKEKTKEVLLLIKTSLFNYRKVEKTLKTYHSYSVPEIISLSVKKGSRDYLAWLDRVVGRKS